jgi:hypothetical protein
MLLCWEESGSRRGGGGDGGFEEFRNDWFLNPPLGVGVGTVGGDCASRTRH